MTQAKCTSSPNFLTLLQEAIPANSKRLGWKPKIKWDPEWTRLLTVFYEREIATGTDPELFMDVALALGGWNTKYADYNLTFQNWFRREKKRSSNNNVYRRPQRVEARNDRRDFKGNWNG